MSSFEPPAPDLVQLQADWDAWEKGEETPGRVLANLKTHGLRAVLAQLVETGWTPKA